MTKEQLIYIRNRWEIATQEVNSATGTMQWIRRDQSFICYVGKETAVMPMPNKPETK